MIKCSLDCCKPLVEFQSPVNFDFNNYCFHRGEAFGDSHCTIPTDVTHPADSNATVCIKHIIDK